MEINTAALVGFRTLYSTKFNEAFNLAAPQLDKIAVRVDSGRVAQVVHRWMEAIPGMREFLGKRKINNLDSSGFTVVNKKWEDTIGIPKEDLERDQFGVYTPLIARMGQVAKLHRDSIGFGMLSAALAAATRANYLAYDQIAFYGVHTGGKRVSGAEFTNVGNEPLTGPNLAAAIANLRKRKDSQGNPLFAAQTKPMVIAAPDLEFTLAQLANASFIVGAQPGTGATSATSQAGATENVLKGTFDYMTSPYIGTATEWHVTLGDPLLRPIIFQVELEIEILTWEKFLHEWSINDQFVQGARALYNVAVGLPESVYGSTGA